MDDAALLMSVGPAPQEPGRLRDFFAALWHWEPGVGTVVLVDDAPETRHLERFVGGPPGVRVHCFMSPRRGEGIGDRGGLAESLLTGLEWIQANAQADFTLKIDSDALVIAPFAGKARAYLAAHPAVGWFGVYDEHCSGKARSFAPWDGGMARLALPFGFPLEAGRKRRRLRQHLFGRPGRERRTLLAARRRGYRWGEHILGGAYIFRMDTLRDLHNQGFLREPEFWRTSRITEEAIIGAYVKAAGWDLAGSARAGEIFGVEYIGLPLPHEELEARGYSLIHSIKNDPRASEDEIRRYFRSKREGSNAAGRQ